ncbi:MAG: hypothetical protein RIT45_1353 [Pseudomonadota bacterium]|jgi:tRNA uridine 5-carboxymethylaminomethyl modification enzyme
MSAPGVGLIHPHRWDVIVVGGGHAGTEAALAAVRMGCDVAMVTSSIDRVGWMSCNPSIGGVGKSHLVAEIDALGGEMARAADRAGVHYKLLNHSRGPAVHALRVQCDKLEYATALRERLERQPGLQLLQGTVAGLWLEGGRIAGVRTGHGVHYRARAVVLTAGTFLSAVCHTGDQVEAGGRAGEGASNDLGAQLRALDLRTLRHKTGTCPRLAGRTIDWDRTQRDPGLTPPPTLARRGPRPALRQMDCHATRTNARTHALIRDALPRSPLFSGQIAGQGPRYCPSIEDKVVRFEDREEHGLFLEREGWRTDEVYLAGLSTSLPADVQFAMVRSIEGLESAEIVRFGYAVEYDTIDPRQLGPDLGLARCPGLYFAGQVNGTSGYEEAGAQGLWAGVQAACFVQERDAPTLSRADAYLAVMVDDLTTRGGGEPYRMLTSRAEHRLSLRCGNADLRLGPLAESLGLCDAEAGAARRSRQARLEAARTLLEAERVVPTPAVVDRLVAAGQGGLGTPASLADLLRRPTMQWETLEPWLPEPLRSGGLLDDPADRDEVTIALRYAAYEARERTRVERTRRAEAVALPADLDFRVVHGLSFEAAEKLGLARPATLGQAARVPGVTPAAVSALHVHLEMRHRRARADG